MLLSATPPAGPRPAQEQRLLDEAVRNAALTPPVFHPQASITWLGPAAANPALAYRLTGDPAHLAESRRWLEAAVRLPHWGSAHMPDHDLDAGWLLHGIALAHHWLGDALPEEVRALVRYKLLLQGRRLYEFAVASEGRWWSSSYWQNHNWICYAGLATAGYVLGREEWTERAKDNLGRVLDALPEDGSHAEGVVYWRYGVPWLAMHLDMLQEAEGIDWRERGGFMANTFRYRLHQSAPGFARTVDHGDCHDRHSGHSAALYYRLASQYGIGEAQWLGDRASGELLAQEAALSGVRPGILPEAYLEHLWYDPAVPAVAPSATQAYFPDLGLLASRTGWDEDATLVSFKASPGGGHKAWETSAKHRAELGWETLNTGHHHPDSGSFVLISQGAHLAVDEGYSNRKRAAHHNLLLVDGQGYADEDRYHVYRDIPYERQARQRDVLADGGWAHATAEIAAMYDPALGVRRLDRTLVFTPSGRLVLLDIAEADAAREWSFLLQTDAPTERSADDLHLIRSGAAAAVVRRFAPARARTESTAVEVEANPTSSTPELRITRTLHTLRTTTPPASTAVFLTVIEPGDVTVADAVACEEGYGIAFGTETVLLSPGLRRIRTAEVTADAAAVLTDGDTLSVVAARRVEVRGHLVLDVREPYTGKVG
ncbi:heparinase II/III family protein [Streptomyces beijiangensis]|uniref:Heparinase II/III family protein n=1 Tax=Streptomyces beijiangensis TaxID=163361 RepID=A0A939F7C0_9ACTN|nr:heparinase II/III family protein [Streptomyces beijiangensis]MBO0513161.1 heparinase II/III family protein [Streptomyces beijiangensis]